jgi:hypothetical protein
MFRRSGKAAARLWLIAALTGAGAALAVPVPSTVALQSPVNPSIVDELISFTAVLSTGGGAPTGLMEFRDGADLIAGCEAITVRFNAAACTLSTLAAGDHSITAAYSGDGTHAPSVSAPLVQHVKTTVTVSVAKPGSGTGTVVAAAAGIDCGMTCAGEAAARAPLSLEATAAAGSVFTGWSGPCSGILPCAFTALAPTTVGATFALLAGTPTAAASPSSSQFLGRQSMMTATPPRIVSILNVGMGIVTITSVATTNPQFVATHACTALAAGESCPVTLYFTPTASGLQNASLLVLTSVGVVNVPLSGTGERSLVTHFYQSILGRQPDPLGKTYWDDEALRLSALAVDVNETWYVMAGYFFASAEYRYYAPPDGEFVADLYLTFLNRPPDAAGLAYWVDQIQNQGMPREVVMFWFMFSAEFRTFSTSIFGNTAARPEVNVVMDFFRGILNRLPDTPSFQYWVGRLRAAQCAGASAVYAEVDNISAAFIFSPEYNTRARNATQVVTDMYYSFLRRGGDTGGVNYWIGQLATGAKDIDTVRTEFLHSAEFDARVQAVIAAGCYAGP